MAQNTARMVQSRKSELFVVLGYSVKEYTNSARLECDYNVKPSTQLALYRLAQYLATLIIALNSGLIIISPWTYNKLVACTETRSTPVKELKSFGRDVKLGVPCLDAACTVGLN